ncbi:MAG: response regulator, partial [Myxococcota bacterium]
IGERAHQNSVRELKVAHRDLLDANTALKSARDEAQRANAIKSALLMRLSHDVRGDISGLLGMCEMWATTTPEAQPELSSRIVAYSHRLLGVVDDLVGYAESPARSTFVSAEQVDIHDDILHVVLATHAFVAEEKGIDLVVDVGASVPRRAALDEERVRSALDKLIQSALAAIDMGEIVVRVELDASEPETFLVVHVHDTGRGFSEQHMRQVLEEDVSTELPNLLRDGILLHIWRRAVEQLGGRHGGSSTPGVGSWFWFTVPYHTFEGPEQDGADEHSLTGYRILVVDDNPTNRAITVAGLEACGAVVEALGSAEKAIDRLCRDPCYAAVVLDVHMPGRSGLDAAAQIRKHPSLGHLPLVLLSSWTTQEARLMSRELKIDCFLPRPVDPKRLARAVRTCVTQPAVQSTTPSERLRVLAADDEEINRRIIHQSLWHHGFEPTVVCNGAEALKRHTAAPFDAILMDCRMPVMDGLESSRAIRALPDPKAAAVPIIAVTASPHPGDQRRCQEAGMDSYMVKPLDFAVLTSRLYGVLEIDPHEPLS